jgi:SAM-dependent methyltransferase
LVRQAHEWEARYQEGTTGWDRGDTSPALAAWLEAGRIDPCRVLIPGCGRGHEVLALARRGFAVTALDFAPSAVGHLKESLSREGLNAKVLQADVLQWQPDDPFDAIYEQTCLCALPEDTWQDYALRLHDWLRPEGRLYALFMQTGQPGGPLRHCDLLRMHGIFNDMKWQWPENEPLFVPHRNGRFELGYILTRK